MKRTTGLIICLFFIIISVAACGASPSRADSTDTNNQSEAIVSELEESTNQADNSDQQLADEDSESVDESKASADDSFGGASLNEIGRAHV